MLLLKTDKAATPLREGIMEDYFCLFVLKGNGGTVTAVWQAIKTVHPGVTRAELYQVCMEEACQAYNLRLTTTAPAFFSIEPNQLR